PTRSFRLKVFTKAAAAARVRPGSGCRPLQRLEASTGAVSAMSLDTYRSPSDAFAATAARRPDAPFLLAPASAGLPYAPQGFRIEYGAFKTKVDRLRAEYAAAGYGRGARVALL